MHIAELFRNRDCLEDLTSELPEGIEYDRESGCLRAARRLPESARWGPFCFEIVGSPQDAHLSVLTSGSHQDDVTLFVRLRVKGERWLMLLNFAEVEAASDAESEADEAASCNMAIVVNVTEQTLYLRALRSLPQGARLVARLSDSCEGDDSLPAEAEPLEQDSASSSMRMQTAVAAPDATAAARRRKRPASADDCHRKLQRLEAADSQRHSEDRSSEDAAALISSLRYCEQCGLFFTSGWMLEVHRQLHGLFEQPVQLRSKPGQPQLVLTAPVLSEQGLAYVPVGLPRVPVTLTSGATTGRQRRPHVQLRGAAAESAGTSSRLSASPSAGICRQQLSEHVETPLDLTLQRLPTTQPPPTPPSMTSAATPRVQQSRLVRIRQLFPDQTLQSQQRQQQQQQQQQLQQRKAAAVSSLMSVCKDCKIGFFNYNNYVVHRSLYCQSSRLAATAAAAAATAAAAAKVQQQQQQHQSPQPPTPQGAKELPAAQTESPQPAATPATTAGAAAPQTAAADRRFQCPYCQIRFHSPSTLSAHQAFYCPENPEKVAGATAAAAAAGAAEAAHETAAGQQHQQLQALQQQAAQSPTWLPILTDCGGLSGGGYKCSICGYIGQTERGMKMHAKIHCGSAVAAAAAAAACASPTSAASDGGGGIRLPAAFPSEILSSMTADELCMLQHKTQPYSKRRTFKRLGQHSGHQQHPGIRPAPARLPLVCVRCGDAFEQLELLLEHQETACASSPATVKLESIRQN